MKHILKSKPKTLSGGGVPASKRASELSGLLGVQISPLQDLCSHEDGIDVKGHGWSVRTRAAAKYLYNRFLELRERKHEETEFFTNLEGKTRSKCARFFYEKLVAKQSIIMEMLSKFLGLFDT